MADAYDSLLIFGSVDDFNSQVQGRKKQEKTAELQNTSQNTIALIEKKSIHFSTK